jgi:transcription antitermination protein NusB
MGQRRKSRELALQVLFHREFNRDPQNWRESFWSARSASESIRNYAEELVKGVVANQDAIDVMLKKHAQHWSVERMTAIDRNVLRLAVYEMFIAKTAPVKVAINEAIEIAKRYGDETSGAFVNGILDSMVQAKEALIEH